MLEPYVRPGIDDRPDLDKVLSPEDKAAVARLAIKNRRRPPEVAGLRHGEKVAEVPKFHRRGF